MKIANPIYDVVFKYLMDNEKIAKTVLSIILDTKIISLQSQSQETVIVNKIEDTLITKKNGTKKPSVVKEHIGSFMRHDFKAVIHDEEGNHKTILIELQKYKSINPIERFRRYLADGYLKSETILKNGKSETTPLPIVTIYILGYMVTKSQILAFKVDHVLKDIIWDVPVEEKMPEFVELLTHQSIILQPTAKPEKKRGTRLEKFLNLFVQKYQHAEANYILDVPENIDGQDKEIKTIVKQLEKAVSDDALIRSMQAEEELEAAVTDLQQSLKDAKKEAKEARKREKDAKKEAKEAKKREEEAKKLAEQERKEKEETLQKLYVIAKLMKANGIPLHQISEATGLSIEEITKL